MSIRIANPEDWPELFWALAQSPEASSESLAALCNVSIRIVDRARATLQGDLNEKILPTEKEISLHVPLTPLPEELREILWKSADHAEIYTNALTRKEYEGAVALLFKSSSNQGAVKFERTSLLSTAYDQLTAASVPPRCRDFILALLETWIPLSRRLLAFKQEVLQEQINERRAYQSQFIQILVHPPEPPSQEGQPSIPTEAWRASLKEILQDLREDLKELDEDFKNLAQANLKHSFELLRGLSGFKTKVLDHKTLPLEGALVRQEFSHRAAHWERFKKQLQALFFLSEGQLAAVKAWRSDSLEGAEETVEQLVLELKRKKSRKGLLNPSGTGLEQKEIKGEDSRPLESEFSIPLEVLYHLWSPADEARLTLIREWEPPQTEGRFPDKEAFRCWLYMLTALRPTDFQGDFAERVAALIGKSPTVFKSMMAHFHGGFRPRIVPGSLKDRAIKAAESFGITAPQSAC